MICGIFKVTYGLSALIPYIEIVIMTKITLNKDDNFIKVIPEIFPASDEFELWAKVFLHHQHISQFEFEPGADRHLMRFTHQNHRFNLNFDDYSESIWIEPDGELAAMALQQLKHLLVELYNY